MKLITEKSVPRYGMGATGDRALAAVEKLLRMHDAGLLGGILELEPEKGRKAIEFWDEGVAKLEAVSPGLTPLQKFAVGIAYTINALRDWRHNGATGTSLGSRLPLAASLIGENPTPPSPVGQERGWE